MPQTVDGMPNFWHITCTAGATRAQLERGINTIQEVASDDGGRIPAIQLGSSPHKAGGLLHE